MPKPRITVRRIKDLPDSMAEKFVDARDDATGKRVFNWEYWWKAKKMPIKFGAYENGKLIGFIVASVYRKVLFVDTPFVLKKGKGIGTQLFLRTITEARKRGLKGIDSSKTSFGFARMMQRVDSELKKRGITDVHIRQWDEDLHWNFDVRFKKPRSRTRRSRRP